MQKEITIIEKDIELKGLMSSKPENIGLVLFAHGSGSSRLSPRNQLVAKILNEKNIATLLFDLLTTKEDEIDEVTLEFRFNIDLLTKRLVLATDWILKQKDYKNFKIGYFGASTGSSAALRAAAIKKEQIRAVVSRGGRPDLSMKYLKDVKAATLLIVGGLDIGVIEFNQQAFEKLTCKKELKIVENATHLFEEPHKLEEIANLAAIWFEKSFKD